MVTGTNHAAVRPLTFGMVGGGEGAFIGAVHRMAATLDGQARFVAGALSASPEKAVRSAAALGLAEDRRYESWERMLASERAREDSIDFVSIVTPNHAHFPVAIACVRAGFHVVCDKPLVLNSREAEELGAAVDKAGVVFGVTYNYTGYPLVKRARDLVRAGAIGPIRKVFVEYHQGWLATRLEATGQKQADWRTDPARAGAGAVGDIGSHAENLVSFITGLEVESLAADVHTFVPGRSIDDDASVLIRYRGGARGVLTCSQVCVGDENSLTVRIHGEQGSLAWAQENPNVLALKSLDGRTEILTRGTGSPSPIEQAATRIPPGHPEGFIEAFANVYRGVFEQIRAGGGRQIAGTLGADVPSVRDGARGVRFIERVLQSRGAWVAF